MIKSAIFDVDGTLLDSMFIWDTLGETYLRSIGYTPKENLNETFKNMSLYQAACYYISEYGVTLSVEEIMDGVNLMIRDFYLNDVKLKPYAADFLQRLNSKGIRMCIATATDKIIVEVCGIIGQPALIGISSGRQGIGHAVSYGFHALRRFCFCFLGIPVHFCGGFLFLSTGGASGLCRGAACF